MCAIACAFRCGVARVGEFIYEALLTPSWENIFRYSRYTGSRNRSKTLVMKKVGLWPIHVFCNILDRISSFVHLNEKFCNKNLFLDFLSVV